MKALCEQQMPCFSTHSPGIIPLPVSSCKGKTQKHRCSPSRQAGKEGSLCLWHLPPGCSTLGVRSLPERSLSAGLTPTGCSQLGGQQWLQSHFPVQRDLMASCIIMDQTLSAPQMLLCCCFLKIYIISVAMGQQSCKDVPSWDTPVLLMH